MRHTRYTQRNQRTSRYDTVGTSAKHLANHRRRLGHQRGREDNVHPHQEIALVEPTGALDGHALVVDAIQLAGLDHLPRLALDVEGTAVHVRNDELEAAKGIGEGHGVVDEEVLAVTGEDRVLLLLQDNDDVAGSRDAADLSALAGEGDLVASAHSLLDVDAEDVAGLNHLLPAARLALVLLRDAAAAATALVARLGGLGHEAGRDLLDDGALPAAVAEAARGVHAGLGRTAAAAGGAVAVTGDGELLHLSAVEGLQRDVDLVNKITRLGLTAGTAATTTTEEATEQVGSRHATTVTTILINGISTTAVIHAALVSVNQDAVGVAELLEGVLIATLIRMHLHSLLLVSTANLILGCRGRHG